MTVIRSDNGPTCNGFGLDRHATAAVAGHYLRMRRSGLSADMARSVVWGLLWAGRDAKFLPYVRDGREAVPA